MDSESQQHSVASATGIARRPGWPALLLGLIPFVALCFTVSLWDHIYPMVGGPAIQHLLDHPVDSAHPTLHVPTYRCDRREAKERSREEGVTWR